MLMNSATSAAKKHGVPGAIAIVDMGGHLVMLESLDDTMNSAANIAIGKAATAVSFRRPTLDIENVVLEGRTPMLMLDSVTPQPYVPLKGGYPVFYQDELVGGIAVAGTMDADMNEVVVLEAIENKGW